MWTCEDRCRLFHYFTSQGVHPSNRTQRSFVFLSYPALFIKNTFRDKRGVGFFFFHESNGRTNTLCTGNNSTLNTLPCLLITSLSNAFVWFIYCWGKIRIVWNLSTYLIFFLNTKQMDKSILPIFRAFWY